MYRVRYEDGTLREVDSQSNLLQLMRINAFFSSFKQPAIAWIFDGHQQVIADTEEYLSMYDSLMHEEYSIGIEV